MYFHHANWIVFWERGKNQFEKSIKVFTTGKIRQYANGARDKLELTCCNWTFLDVRTHAHTQRCPKNAKANLWPIFSCLLFFFRSFQSFCISKIRYLILSSPSYLSAYRRRLSLNVQVRCKNPIDELFPRKSTIYCLKRISFKTIFFSPFSHRFFAAVVERLTAISRADTSIYSTWHFNSHLHFIHFRIQFSFSTRNNILWDASVFDECRPGGWVGGGCSVMFSYRFVSRRIFPQSVSPILHWEPATIETHRE